MENIYKAFVKFQSEFKGMKPDSSNPFFKSTYISLDGILETVRPILAKNGLAIIQEATGDGEYIFVKTKLIHESGEMIETEILKMKPQKNDPQSMGSCITYSKRYQLAALLGICECVDEDANLATFGYSSPDQYKSNGKLSAKQVGRLLAIGLKAGIKEPEIKKVIKAEFGKDKIEDLSIEDYNSVCSRLEVKVK